MHWDYGEARVPPLKGKLAQENEESSDLTVQVKGAHLASLVSLVMMQAQLPLDST